jgi:hypothetical protein
VTAAPRFAAAGRRRAAMNLLVPSEHIAFEVCLLKSMSRRLRHGQRRRRPIALEHVVASLAGKSGIARANRRLQTELV